MDPTDLVRRLRASFVEELDEGAAAFERDLLALERAEPGSEVRVALLEALLRVAHKLKGAARAVDLPAVERTFHLLEEVLTRARDGIAELEVAGLEVLLRTIDALRETGTRLRVELAGRTPAEPEDAGEAALESALPRLEALAGGGATAIAMPAAPSPPAGGAEEMAAANGTTATTATTVTAAESATLRIPATRVDRLLSHAAELGAVRTRLEARVEGLASLREEIRSWSREWRDAGGHARRLGTDPAAPLLAAFRERIAALEREVDALAKQLEADRGALDGVGSPLNDALSAMRMLPFGLACEGLERIARDVARARGKEVALRVESIDLEIDRAVLEAIRAPLQQLVRNAVDHGIESPDERRAAGKPEAGKITVSAVLKGSQVDVSVEDDGRGLDLERIRRHAERLGIPVPEDPAELAALVFRSGFSTAGEVTDLSGRGVGLDVVSGPVEAVHGRVRVSTRTGRGACFSLSVPLTLGVVHALLVGCAGRVFALPQSGVERVLRVPMDRLRKVGGRPAIPLAGENGEGEQVLRVLALEEALGLEAPAPRAGRGATRAGVVLAAGERRAVLLTDEVLAEREIVAKGLGRRIRRLRYVAGWTSLPDGTLAPILHPADLLERPVRAFSAPPIAAARPRPRVLVVDDSMTTRTLMAGILEQSGYDVTAVADGEAAWRVLQERGADALVSDVQMPRMDGVELTRTVRAAPRFADLPIILVTGLADEEDRMRGLEAGANAYLVKSAFDQRSLLEALSALAGDES